jgi:diamine N-acetyltransferase
MNMSLKIRRAEAGDSQTVLEFTRDLACLEGSLQDVVATPMDIASSLFSSTPAAYCELAEWRGEPAGFAVWSYNYSIFLGKRCLWLEDLFVAERFRRMGIGRSLLSHLARRCRDEGLGRMEWSVLHTNNPAVAFWGRNKSSSKSYAKVERIVNPRREILAHILLLFVAERRRAAERLSFQLGALETGLRSLNQQTALELGDGIEHVHVHRAGGVGEIGAAERDTVDLYAHFSQCFDRGADVDRVAAEPIKLGHDQYVT